MKRGGLIGEMKFRLPLVVGGFLNTSLFLVEFLDPHIPSRSPPRHRV
jgi:hypothetical protein